MAEAIETGVWPVLAGRDSGRPGAMADSFALAARDAEAREAGIMVLPAAGFDVVPSD